MSDRREFLKLFRKRRRHRLTHRLNLMRERVRLLELELDRFTNQHFRVCIFGSARIQPEDEIYQTTEKLALYLGELNIDVLTGGGPGLMEAANKGAHAGRSQAGSHSWSYGISIDLGKIEPLNEHLDVKHHHKKFSSRLDDFMRLSHAVVVNPGGIGTLLELYFSWQLLQVGHLPNRPIILLNRKFWQGLIDWMNQEQVGPGLVSPGDMSFVHIVDTAEEAIGIIAKEYELFQQNAGITKEHQAEEQKTKRQDVRIMEVEVTIEIPKGSRNKYEYDYKRQVMRLDRTLFAAVHYPSDYGFISNTLAEDGDALDALVLVWEPTFPGCVIDAKPVGVFLMSDEKGTDEKILCVPLKDPLWNYVDSLSDVPPHLLREVEHFFDVYKDLENKIVTTRGWRGKERAESIVKLSFERYEQQSNLEILEDKTQTTAG